MEHTTRATISGDAYMHIDYFYYNVNHTKHISIAHSILLVHYECI